MTGGLEARDVAARALFLDALPELEPTLPPNYALAAWDQVATTTADRTSLAPFYRAADAVLAALDLPALLAEAEQRGRDANADETFTDYVNQLAKAHAKGAAEALTEAAVYLQAKATACIGDPERDSWEVPIRHAAADLAELADCARADAATGEDTEPVDDPEIMTVFIDGVPKPKLRHRFGMVEHPGEPT